ncbi:MAG TPA: FAD-linked oxidase C-terminal domain-containing protein [Solirubrobacteraceae bacterium]|jgi:glycolate oxidase subunit GlcD|nr:FAD-linked oxidase C-terminal domain-containing protein [Solirubrobacteraceae bacterium]
MSQTIVSDLRDALTAIVGAQHVLDVPTSSHYNHDATIAGGRRGGALLAVRPGSTAQVAEVVRSLYEREVPIVPRGGGSGLAGGAVPSAGSVVCSLERMTAVRELSPRSWRMHVEAGLTTAHVHRLARENGLLFPPDPGASEQSQIGGNVATNAGGPHAFKYGATRDWVTGIEAVLAGGEIVQLGGACRKDVGGYDLRGLLIGSEGTLGVITAVQLRLTPAPEQAIVLVAFFDSEARGCEAILEVLGSGVLAAALDFLDGATLRAATRTYPGQVPPEAAFALLIEVDGSAAQTQADRDELLNTLAPICLGVQEPASGELWRWRDGINPLVAAIDGGKVGEDVVVPVERLHDLLRGFEAIAAENGLKSCAWGHGADGNVHANVLIDPRSERDQQAVARVGDRLLDLVVAMGGAISGEHGLGLIKSGGQLSKQWNQAAVRLHEKVKQEFDPKGLFNPGKKLP